MLLLLAFARGIESRASQSFQEYRKRAREN